MHRSDRTDGIALAFVLTSAVAACGARSALRDTPFDGAVAPDVARPSDAALDGPPPDHGCTTNDDCNDGLDCTTERCSRGQCLYTAYDNRCDDHLACTGVERCDVRLGCVSSPPDCNDGIECTHDQCDELRGACTHVPDDTLCPISHRCIVERGCVAHALAHSRQTLIEVELPAGVVNILSHTSATLTDIALAPDRTLYGIAHGEFYRVDEHTGDATLIAAVAGDFNGLDAAPDGSLYAGSSGGIYKLDPMTGATVFAAPFPPGLEASGDLAFLQGRLLATARTDPNSLDELVEVDLTAATSRVIGPIGYGCVWGLAAFGPTLYGLTCNGQVLRIDPDTGTSVELTRATAMFYGATAR